MPTLTLYRTRCGKWPAGPPTTELKRTDATQAPWWGSKDDVCESCLRSWARTGQADQDGQLSWIRRRPGLVWHLLIPDHDNADPKFLPPGFQPPVSSTAPMGMGIAATGNITAVAGPARQPGETDDDIRRKAGVEP